MVNDNTIICEVKVEITKADRKKIPTPMAIKVTKAINNKVKKLIPPIVEKIKADMS